MHQQSEAANTASAGKIVHDTRRLCTHTFKEGHGCAGPALRNQSFCYWHHPSRRSVANPNERRARRIAREAFHLDVPTSKRELRSTLGELISLIAANQIDTRRAGLLLNAIQTIDKHLPDSATPPQAQSLHQRSSLHLDRS